MRVWVALGSNLGDSNRILQEAWQGLGQEATISLLELSHPYVTAPVGMESENLFLNAVGILETSLEPEKLLLLLQGMERDFGRDKKGGEGGYQDRLLDLDLLYCDDRRLLSSDLVLPHPHIAERLFVLAPLTEIDPEHLDPQTGKTAEAMYHELLRRMQSGEEALQEIQQGEWA